MNEQPTAIDFLAQEISRLTVEKALLQQAYTEALKKIETLEQSEEE